jgi:hypothetical protein
MAAGLGFKDFVTGEVLTSADVDGYLMQGVWVFASAAARDAAVTSPQEGNFAYLKDTNVTTYYTGSAWANLDTTGMTNPMTTTGDTIYSSSGSTPARLGIGSTGNVLTVAGGVPTWAAPAGGGGMTLLATTTLTGASVTVSSISGSYKNLYIVVRDFLPASDSAQFKVQLNADTTANRHGAQTTNNTSTAFDSTFIICSGEADNAVAENLVTITIPDYANTDTWKFVFTAGVVVSWNNTAQFRPYNNTGAYNQTTAISSIKYLTDGNFTSGTALLYGVS